MRITQPNDVALGQWYTVCCAVELTQIADDSEAAQVSDILRGDMEDPEAAIGIKIWDTEESALSELPPLIWVDDPGRAQC